MFSGIIPKATVIVPKVVSSEKSSEKSSGPRISNRLVGGSDKIKKSTSRGSALNKEASSDDDQLIRRLALRCATDDPFNAFITRFRKEVLSKLTRSDLTSNNDMLRSVYNRLVDVILASRTDYTHANQAKMNLIEFKISMRTVFQSASPPFRLEELRALYYYLDTDHDGRIGPEEFVIGVKGQLNIFRSAIVDFTFRLLDSDDNGSVSERELMNYLQKTGTPGIAQGGHGMTNPKRMLQHVVRKIGNKGKDGSFTLKDFQNYYIDRGLFIFDDIMFKYEVQDDWLVHDADLSKYLRVTLKQHLESRKGSMSLLDDLLNQAPDGAGGKTDGSTTPEEIRPSTPPDAKPSSPSHSSPRPHKLTPPHPSGSSLSSVAELFAEAEAEEAEALQKKQEMERDRAREMERESDREREREMERGREEDRGREIDRERDDGSATGVDSPGGSKTHPHALNFSGREGSVLTASGREGIGAGTGTGRDGLRREGSAKSGSSAGVGMGAGSGVGSGWQSADELMRAINVLSTRVQEQHLALEAKDAKLASYEAMLKDQLEVIDSQQTVIAALTKSHNHATRGAL